MNDELRRKALDALYARYEQLKERAGYLLALYNALTFENAPTHDRFNVLAKETLAIGWEDYTDRFTPTRALQAWLDANTYTEDEGPSGLTTGST